MKALLIVLAVMLAGCGQIAEWDAETTARTNLRREEAEKASHAQIESNLPEGCAFKYVGVYYTSHGTSLDVVSVTCEAHKATAISEQHRSGKSNKQTAQVFLEQQ